MSDRSAIEWTESTWNPVRGCTKVSAGCKHCYAETFAERFRGVKGHPYEQGFDLRLVPEALDLPLRWRKPRRVFVNSMSDLFHEDVPDTFIAKVFAVMGLAYWHTFQVLTKRAERMRLIADDGFWNLVNNEIDMLLEDEDSPVGPGRGWNGLERRSDDARATAPDPNPEEPLPNVWLGVSVEDQAAADERIPELLATPAAVRFISAEPLLGPVDLDMVITEGSGFLDWVIVGGESGPKARPMNLAWALALVEQCRAAGVPAFVKQLGRRPFLAHPKGGDPAEWPEDLRVREWPRGTLGKDGG